MPDCRYCGVQGLRKGEPFDPKRELRPYGPGGSWVCHPCASATPERRRETEAGMRLAFDMAEAASPYGSVVIGPGVEPSPLVHPPDDTPTEPQLCPACGSDDPKVREVDDILRPCTDPFHSQPTEGGQT